MSTLHKVKAYFGMAPMDDYDDEYYDDDERDTGAPRGRSYGRRGERFDDTYAGGRYDGRDYDDPRGDYDARPPAASATPTSRATGPASSTTCRGRPRFGSLRGLDPRRTGHGPAPDGGAVRRRQPAVEDHHAAAQDYSEARTIGERFRDGQPVIMDLVSMDNADAKRLVDFAAGLAFALRGSFDKVATKVFLLAGRRRRQRRGASPDRRGGVLQLPVAQPGGRPSADSVG